MGVLLRPPVLVVTQNPSLRDELNVQRAPDRGIRTLPHQIQDKQWGGWVQRSCGRANRRGFSLNSDGLDPRFNEFVRVLCHSKMFRFLPLEIHRTFQQVLPASRLVVEIQFPESKISDNSDSTSAASPRCDPKPQA